MVKRILAAIVWAVCLRAAVPTPKEHFGFTPGDDYKLADSGQLFGYFQKLAAASDRIRFVQFGKSALGKPMYVAFISAPENLQRLDRLREISRRLALGEATEQEARALADEGRAVVWIDSGLHASEIAPAQQAPHLAYRMLTDESPEVQAIRREVVLLQIPCINPDGLDWIAHWYAKNVGTPYELAPLPWLYQKYSGHDNNRDYFMLNLEETRHVTRLMLHDWFPQILYNQHQAPPFPARIFIPPYAEPLNPHIPPAVMEGINRLGAAMRERFAREDKPGVLSYWGYDAWWNGGLRSVPAFHNIHGILTETAITAYATPRTYKPSEIHGSFANGMPVREPWIFYEKPWLGGRWGVREAIDYMLTADFAILEEAAARRSDYLLKAWRMARASMAQAKPYAYVIAPEQWDASSVPEMLDRLQQSAIEIRRARSAFQAGGRDYPAGTIVIPAAQPFRPYLMDLLERQHYPDIRKRPYDIAGWTLPMNMGVKVDRVEDSFTAELEAYSSPLPDDRGSALDPRQNAAFTTIADMLQKGAAVRWGKWELRRPRVALYQPWTANADEGWTEWLLDKYKVPYTLLHNADIQNGGLRSRFDSIVVASQTAQSILHGQRNAQTPEGETPVVQRPEYTGGIETAGLLEIQNFVRDGGTLIAFDNATELPIQSFPLSLRNVVRGDFNCPGSLIRIDVDTSQPVAFGMPKETVAFSTGGQAFDITAASEVTSIARYAKENLLASGWVSGERAVLGKHALVDAKYGRGHVVLFAFRPQFRGQSFGTFKFILNAIYLASAKTL